MALELDKGDLALYFLIGLIGTIKRAHKMGEHWDLGRGGARTLPGEAPSELELSGGHHGRTGWTMGAWVQSARGNDGNRAEKCPNSRATKRRKGSAQGFNRVSTLGTGPPFDPS
jgi:hypothetical protein